MAADNDLTSLDLVELIEKGEIDRVLAFLRASGSGEMTDEGGKDGLMYACEARSPELLVALLASGARIDGRDGDQATALHHAARTGDLAMVRPLVEAGADVEALAPDLGLELGRSGEDHLYVTPLLMAGLLKHREVFDYLATLTSDRERARVDRIINKPSRTSDRRPAALVRAAGAGKVETVKKLLAEGVGPDVQNGRGETPLIQAALMRQPEVVTLLLEAGADVEMRNDRDERAIGRAGDARTIRLLADAGADLDAPEEGRNILPFKRMTPLMFWACAGNVEALGALLSAGAKVDAANSAGWTPLIQAAERGRVESIKLLLQAGADPTPVTENGLSALNLAIRSGDAEAIRLLAGAIGEEKLEVPDFEGFTHLGFACQMYVYQSSVIAITSLVAVGASVETRSVDGRTPLMIAAGRGNRGIIKLLLDAGADKSATLPDGRTALDLVDFDMIDMLAHGEWGRELRRLLGVEEAET